MKETFTDIEQKFLKAMNDLEDCVRQLNKLTKGDESKDRFIVDAKDYLNYMSGEISNFYARLDKLVSDGKEWSLNYDGPITSDAAKAAAWAANWYGIKNKKTIDELVEICLSSIDTIGFCGSAFKNAAKGNGNDDEEKEVQELSKLRLVRLSELVDWLANQVKVMKNQAEAE